MKRLILFGLIIQICCTESKKAPDLSTDTNFNQVPLENPKIEKNINHNYCLQDFDCYDGLTSKGFDSVWVDDIEILKIRLKLICNKVYTYSDTAFFEKNSPCEKDSVIYRYIQNNLIIEHTFKGRTKTIEITPFSLKDFFEDKRLAKHSYIGPNFSLSIDRYDSSVSIRVPVYFREIDIGEIGVIEIDKTGNTKVKSIEKYEGFVPN